MSIKGLENYTFTAKYARYSKDKKRREIWRESSDRVMDMHLDFYKDKGIDEEIRWAFDRVKKKLVLGSQRALQYGGEPILRKHERIYNCSYLHIDKYEAFSQTMYLLLCGCGVGFSVQKHHIEQLPDLVHSKDGNVKFVIEDSIEGWADAIGVLVASYLKIPNGEKWSEYSGLHVQFDYTKIRKKGESLSHGCGKAPGPEPLKKAISNIRSLLDRSLESTEFANKRLRTIDAYDIIMYSADAVISGGHRRSATICIFSPDDNAMMTAKTGNWFTENPQRGRSNNSALLVRSETSRETFDKLLKCTREFGEPGFIWADHEDVGFNPCVTSDTNIATKDGLFSVDNLIDKKFNALVDGKVYKTESNGFWKTGTKDVIEIEFKSGRKMKCTPDHKIMTTNGWKQAHEVSSEDEVVINNHREYNNIPYFGTKESDQGYLLGSFLGDGNVSNDYAQLKWWGDDKEKYRNEAVQILKNAEFSSCHTKDEQSTTAVYSSVGSKKLLDFAISKGCFENGYKHIDKKTINGSWSYLTGLVAGYFDADGTVLVNPQKGSSIRISSSQVENLENIQIVLNAFGIYSKIYKDRKPAGYYEMPDGHGGVKEYYCEASNELVISCDNIVRFKDFIPVKNQDKLNKINEIVNNYKRLPNRTNFTDTIINKKYIGKQDVYDCTVEKVHAFDANGVYVHNCCEISFMPFDEITNTTGVGFCNLCEINGKKIVDEATFEEACRAAAIIGTLQAGYTHFPYLGEASENIAKKEALLGCSITGMMENPDILFDPKLQRRMAKIIKKVNAEIAEKIGINPTARATAIKPAGTTSCILGTSSGVHPHHAKRYIRRVQANKMENVYQFFKQYNPHACEASVWSTNNTDDVISFCVEVPAGSKTKNQISAIELLELVKLTQQNWVEAGTTPERSIHPSLRHNVSNTINVKADEWDDVGDFIYKNRNYFAGISLLSVTGDKDYPQAPFSAIYLPSEMASYYGDCAMFVSGLIQKALELFEDNLWNACDNLLMYCNDATTIIKGTARNEWIKRCINFAGKYCDGDVKKLTYCMKDVFNYKLWLDLQRDWKDVDYTELIEEEDNTKIQETVACAGGVCEII